MTVQTENESWYEVKMEWWNQVSYILLYTLLSRSIFSFATTSTSFPDKRLLLLENKNMNLSQKGLSTSISFESVKIMAGFMYCKTRLVSFLREIMHAFFNIHLLKIVNIKDIVIINLFVLKFIILFKLQRKHKITFNKLNKQLWNWKKNILKLIYRMFIELRYEVNTFS